jgi:hypothetical protein
LDREGPIRAARSASGHDAAEGGTG